MARAVNKMHGCVNAMRATGEKCEAGARLINRFSLGQQATTTGNDCVGGEHIIIGNGCGDDAGFFSGETLSMGAGQFALQRRLINVGGKNGIRLKTDLPKQSQPTRRGAGQNEAWCGPGHATPVT